MQFSTKAKIWFQTLDALLLIVFQEEKSHCYTLLYDMSLCTFCILKMLLQVQLYYKDVFNDRNSIHVLYLHLLNPFEDNDGNCCRLR